MLRSSFRSARLRSAALLALALSAFLAVSGCRNTGNTFDMSRHAAQWAAAKTAARQELAQVQPPLKSAYLAIDREAQWKNPYLSIEQNMIQLRIYLPDEKRALRKNVGKASFFGDFEILRVRIHSFP